VNFELLFDVAQAGYRAWWISLVTLPVLVIAFLLWVRPQLMERIWPVAAPSGSWPSHSWMGGARSVPAQLQMTRPEFNRAGFFVALFIFAVAAVMPYFSFWSLRHALETGQYEIVEGRITNFRPQSDFVYRKRESFDVGAEHFEYANTTQTGAYNQSRALGGRLAQGAYVRIAHRRDAILRLELATE
jgi:hypothetical protein